METNAPAVFTDFNISDEMRKENPNLDEEFEFHQKNSYINTKENKNKKGSNKRLTINHYPE